MAARPAVAVAALLLLYASAAAASGPHMADLSVLLPPRMTRPVEYRLVGGDGCFAWYLCSPSFSALRCNSHPACSQCDVPRCCSCNAKVNLLCAVRLLAAVCALGWFPWRGDLLLDALPCLRFGGRIDADPGQGAVASLDLASGSLDHHDIISVKPEYNDSSKCSTSARLASIAPYSGRKETSVYATDIISGVTIHCKVFVDRISRIRIFHHSVKIDLDEVATLRVHAFDDEDNVFSTLVGLQFMWQLTPASLDNSDHHLLHIPLKETHLSDCTGFCVDMNARFELEDSNLGSDLFVVKGVGIGQETVSAQLLEPQFEHVNDTITLTVAEAMSLEPPSPVLVTLGVSVNFRLKIFRQKVAQVVNLPSQYHLWHVTNSSVAQVDSSLGVVHALSLGFTNVVVEDTRVSGHKQVSSLHVVIPRALFLYLVPVMEDSDHLYGITNIPSSEVWYVFPGKEYMVLAKAFAEGFDTREIFITEENNLRLESSTLEFWNLSWVQDNSVVHTSRLLFPISQGKGYLVASLTYQAEASGSTKVLKLVQEVNVCSKVKATWDEGTENSNIIRLPWVPGVHQEVKLTAVGGCGRTMEDYKFFSSDESIVSIYDSRTIRAKKPGQAVIKVFSAFDSLNFDEVIIEVSTPSALAILPIFPVEVAVGTQLHAAVTFKTSNGHSYSRCDYFNAFIRWSLLSENQTFEVVEAAEAMSVDALKHHTAWKQYGSPCAWISLNASAAGRATLVATVSSESESYLETFNVPIFLKATSKVSAYYPLMVLQAGNGNQFGGYWVDLSTLQNEIQNMGNNSPKELYLVPGSTMDVFLLGGPEQWDKVVDFVETVDVVGEPKGYMTGSTAVQKISSGLYRVSCQSKGNFKLLFSRGNMIGKDHSMPAIAKSELSIVCDLPSAITLIANENENRLDILEVASKADRSPDRLQLSPVVISNGRSIRLAASGVHGNGRFFANSSSLCLKWEITECEGLAYLDQDEDAETLDQSSWETFLVLQNSTGLCTARATVIGFSSRIASQTREEHLFLQSANYNLTDAVQLQIVSSLRVTPEYVLLVNHPEAQEILSVSGGTCFLDASTNDTHVVQIVQQPGKALCSQLVLGARGLGSAFLTIQDIGLSPRVTTSSLVRVANVDWIQILSEEHISIMEGTTEEFQISAGTQDGQVFGDFQYKYMGVEVHLGDEILELINPRDLLGGPKFSIKASKTGTTSLYVSAKQHSGQRVLSQVVNVEVYKPLQIHPEYIYLTPGASFVLSVKGGPKIGVSIEYTSLNVGTLEVQTATGKLLAKTVGNSTVRAAVLANGGTIICEAFGRVEVGIPVAMGLSTQSDRLCVGCSMPIYPSLPKGDPFSFYETCQSYTWIIADQKVVTFQSNGSSNAFIINHVIGRSAGKTKISVSVTCDFSLHGSSRSVSYDASKTILVVPDPPLARGLPITWLFPPFYTTTDLLPRSVNSFGDPDSHDLESTIGYSLLRSSGRSDPAMQNANIIDGSKIRTGESNALDCIQAKDHSTGRTEIASCLRVAEVAQVRVAVGESSIQIAHLSVNDKVELDVKYADELGYIFSEALGIAPVKIETNNPDVVSIVMHRDGNGTYGAHQRFVLQARSHGTALVRLHISHPSRKSDFIMVSVVDSSDVVIRSGQHLNFTINGKGQTEKVEVGYAKRDKTEPSSSSSLTTLAIILLCVAVPAATIAILMKLLERPVRQAPPRHAAPSSAAAGLAAALDPASPRTPQPFMEYVRRTMDDTPYYNRGARRRFNPQNTY